MLDVPTINALYLAQLMLAIALPPLAIWTAIARRHRWTQPLKRLLELVPEVRAGTEPIESLNQASGRLAPLAAICQELLRDIRQEQLRITQLEHEVQQRIASRTEALERRIGALRQQASRDGLTGLLNRRTLDAYLPEAIERCAASNTPLCVLMIDIDNFKPLNDTLGHAAGDEMLKSLAQIIKSTLSHTDVAFRNGGDEFVIVLEGATSQVGTKMAERLASLGANLGSTFKVPNPPRLSIGIANLSDIREPHAPTLLRAADAALYKVKVIHHAVTGSTRGKLSA